jgi:hypothetical protein
LCEEEEEEERQRVDALDFGKTLATLHRLQRPSTFAFVEDIFFYLSFRLGKKRFQGLYTYL